MKTFSPLCTAWQLQVKAFFYGLHGYQSKTSALFVLGAIRAESLVLPRVAEALLEESDAKAPNIERRLERFLSNPRIETQEVWKPLLDAVMPQFQKDPIRFVIDLTSYEEYEQVIYLGIIQHSRVLPVVWKVMPGQEKWDQGLWEAIEQLFKRLEPYLKNADYTLIGDSAFGCFPMVKLCQKYGWHYVFRICEQHTCEHWSADGRLLPTCSVSELVSEPGKRFYGPVRLWQEDQIETNLSGCWEEKHEKALLVISDRPACRRRILEYRQRWKVESTFEDMKSRGWNWEACHVRRLDRVDLLLLVLFLLLWWLAHLAACCIRHGKRDRYDRHDRRDKNIFRLEKLYLLDIERRARKNKNEGSFKQCLLFRGGPNQWFFLFDFNHHLKLVFALKHILCPLKKSVSERRANACPTRSSRSEFQVEAREIPAGKQAVLTSPVRPPAPRVPLGPSLIFKEGIPSRSTGAVYHVFVTSASPSLAGSPPC